MRGCRAGPRLLLVCWLCLQGGRPGASDGQAPPAAPEQVRFLAHTFQHRLTWAPAANRSRGLLRYDVHYKRYGNRGWTPVGRCTAIARRACDLTAETAEPWSRYFARVRALAADGTPSRWTLAGPFSPKEATLQLGNMSLSLSGNILRVTLELPVHRGRHGTLTSEDLHPGGWGQYRVYVRRASNNEQYMLVETNRTFDLPALVWGERYCVSVEPHLPSRPNPAKRTEEQCISTSPLKGSTRAGVALSLALLSLMAAAGVVMAWVHAYVKKPMETPSVLKSFPDQASPWLCNKPWPLAMRGMDLCLEVESIHQISLDLKDKDHSHTTPAGVSLSSGAWLVPGMHRLPEALASNRAGSPQLRDLTDSSICHSDSGICLQEPLDSHSLPLPTGPLECRGPMLGTKREGSILEGRGLGVEEHLLRVAPPARQAEPEDLNSKEASKPGDPPQAQFSGYRRQAGAPREALGSSSLSPCSEGLAPPKPLLPSGYLKQASVAAPLAVGPLALARHGQLHFLSSMAPGGSESMPCLPEFPKALLAPGFLEPPPHLSLLHSSAHLNLNLPWCRT